MAVAACSALSNFAASDAGRHSVIAAGGALAAVSSLAAFPKCKKVDKNVRSLIGGICSDADIRSSVASAGTAAVVGALAAFPQSEAVAYIACDAGYFWRAATPAMQA